MPPKRKQPAAPPSGGSKNARAAAAEPESSGSEDLVSHSGGSGPDASDNFDDDDDDDEEAPQEPAPDDGEGSDFEELQVDFEFFDLKPVDFHGLRALFQRYLDGELPFALSELVETLIQQGNSVGCVVKANGDVDPLGVVSVLALDTHREHPAVQQILAFARRKCSDPRTQSLFDQACASPRVGLIMSERMLNMPPEVAPPLTTGLFDEIADIGGDWWWKSEKEPTEALRKSYEFDRYIVLTRVYRDDEQQDAAGAGPSGGAAGASKKARPAAASASQKPLIFPKPEDEAYHTHAAWSFLFPAAVAEATAVADRASKLTQMRLVMCVEATKAMQVQRDTQRIVEGLAGAAGAKG